MVKKKKSGFTLLEMIIVVGLITVVIGIVNSIFMTGIKVFSASDVKTTLQIEGQKIQEEISDICMEAHRIQKINDEEIYVFTYDEHDKEKKTVIKKDGRNLLIDIYDDKGVVTSNRVLTEILNNLKIDYTNNLLDFSLDFRKDQGFSKDVTYQIYFTVTSRNKN